MWVMSLFSPKIYILNSYIAELSTDLYQQHSTVFIFFKQMMLSFWIFFSSTRLFPFILLKTRIFLFYNSV